MLPTLGPIRPWTDPTITSIGRLPMHVPITRARRRSLDGDWSFALFDHPDHVPHEAIAAELGQGQYPVLGRFNLGTVNPNAPDATENSRNGSQCETIAKPPSAGE